MITGTALFFSFIGGVTADTLLILWAHFAERNKLPQLFLFAMLQGAAGILGIGGAIQGWPNALACVFGYGCGSLIGVYVKRRIERQPPDTTG